MKVGLFVVLTVMFGLYGLAVACIIHVLWPSSEPAPSDDWMD